MANGTKGSSPAATGPAGAEFEVKVGASYFLSMLCEAPARGLPGSIIQDVAFQQGDDGHPMDDIIVTATLPSGEAATLEIQAKRTITFAPKDEIFKKVMSQVAKTVKEEGFWERRVELAVATSQTSRQISGSYQEVLSWSRETKSEKSFFTRLERKGTANDDMRSFVSTFREHLSTFDVADDDPTVWKLLRRFQILVFDFSKNGGAEDYWAIERCRGLLGEAERHLAGQLWDSIITKAFAVDVVGVRKNRAEFVAKVEEGGLKLNARWGAQHALRNLAEMSGFAMDDVSDSIQGLSLVRHGRIEEVHTALSKGRYLEIQGGSGVGKSALMKRYVSQITNNKSVLFLSPNRATIGGWQALRHKLEFKGTAQEFLVELSASGSSIICIDNLDFFSEQEKKTVKDLVRATSEVPGIQIITTARTKLDQDEPNWLPSDILDEIGRAPVMTIEELNEQEIEELKAADLKLAALLHDDHPAKSVARNLYRLSRLAQLNLDESRLHTEVDLVNLWWTRADGIKDDDFRDRQRLLRAMAWHYTKSNEFFSSTEHTSKAIQQLVNSATLSDHGNDLVSFKHDVLREWAVACLLDFEKMAFDALDISSRGTPNFLRSVELQTQMMLEKGDKSGWVKRLDEFSESNVHLSWFRVVLLAIIHSESSSKLLQGMTAELLADDAKIGQQLIALAIASESQTLQSLLSQQGDKTPNIPIGFHVPKNSAWLDLLVWLLKLEKIPTVLIPFAADLMSSWMMGLMGYAPYSKEILTLFYKWLVEIETSKYPRSFQDRRAPFGGGLSSVEVKSLEGNLRLYFCMFGGKATDWVALYLEGVLVRNIPDHIIVQILKMSKTLAKVAPKELSTLTRNVLITDQSSGRWRRENRNQGLSSFDREFLPVSPAQGSFFSLLTHSPEEGLKLVCDLVNHVIGFQIKNWKHNTNEPIIVPFDSGDRVFRYSQSFHWSRNSECYSVTSALMALEAWGHKRVENGDKVLQVVEDILKLEDTPVAMLTVAVDILLSSESVAYADILPFLASPELVILYRLRSPSHDLGGFSLPFSKEPVGEVSIAYLKERTARQHNLEQIVPQFTFHASTELREKLRQKLQKASNCLGQPEVGSNYGDPRLMALNLICQLDPQNYEEQEFHNEKGEQAKGWSFKAPPELSPFTDQLDRNFSKISKDMEISHIEHTIGFGIEDSSKITPELLTKAVKVTKVKTSDDKQSLDFIAGTALCILRDGDDQLKDAHGNWAVEKLIEFGTQDGDYHGGGLSLLQYNRAALALIGLSHALKSPLSDNQIRPILKTVSKHGQAIAIGLSHSLKKLEEIEPKLIKSIVRVAVVGCIFPHRNWQDEEGYKARNARSEQRISLAIDAEIDWILNDADEPEWSKIPDDQSNPDNLIFDDSSIARILTASIDHCRADEWLLEVLDIFWTFTSIKNGIEGERFDSFGEWNDCYYSFLAEAMTMLPKPEAQSLLVERLTVLPDDSFLDSASSFLLQLDDMTLEKKSISMELAVEFREVVAGRMMLTNSWKRLVGDKSGSMDSQFRPAISLLFFNSAGSFSPAESRLFELGIRRIDPVIPLFVKCIESAPSHAIAHFIMNLVEVIFMPSHKPMVLALANGCLKHGITERGFWIETTMGARICRYFEALQNELDSSDEITELSVELDDILNHLIQIGVPEAQRLYDVLGSKKVKS